MSVIKQCRWKHVLLPVVMPLPLVHLWWVAMPGGRAESAHRLRISIVVVQTVGTRSLTLGLVAICCSDLESYPVMCAVPELTRSPDCGSRGNRYKRKRAEICTYDITFVPTT
jgi:hypothetical protein